MCLLMKVLDRHKKTRIYWLIGSEKFALQKVQLTSTLNTILIIRNCLLNARGVTLSIHSAIVLPLVLGVRCVFESSCRTTN